MKEKSPLKKKRAFFYSHIQILLKSPLFLRKDPLIESFVGTPTKLFCEIRAPHPDLGWRGAVAGKPRETFLYHRKALFASTNLRVGTPRNKEVLDCNSILDFSAFFSAKFYDQSKRFPRTILSRKNGF